jgi:hypothetical protein
LRPAGVQLNFKKRGVVTQMGDTVFGFAAAAVTVT